MYFKARVMPGGKFTQIGFWTGPHRESLEYRGQIPMPNAEAEEFMGRCGSQLPDFFEVFDEVETVD